MEEEAKRVSESEVSAEETIDTQIRNSGRRATKEDKGSFRKRKRREYKCRLKERHVSEWEALTEEEKEARKRERKLKQEMTVKVRSTMQLA